MKRRDFIREIEDAGWTLLREGSNHSVYDKKGRQFPVPRHNEIKPGLVSTWRKLNKGLENNNIDELECIGAALTRSEEGVYPAYTQLMSDAVRVDAYVL